jgi:glycosidase
MGMWGADDPDQRKPLWWSELCFEDENRNNFQPGLKLYDPVGFNQTQFNYYKKLIAIRKTNPVLIYGDIEFLTATGGHLIYRRFDEQNEILVCFNNQDLVWDFTLPSDAHYINLLEDDIATTGVLHLEPLKSAILKTVLQ